jgi:DNA replication protein DnaC
MDSTPQNSPELTPAPDLAATVQEVVGRVRSLTVISADELAREEWLEKRRQLIVEAQFPPRANDVAGGCMLTQGPWANACEELRRILNEKDGGTLVLFGPTRRGKTVMAVALGRFYIGCRCRSVRYVRLMRLMLRFEQAQRLDNQSRYGVLEEFCEYPLLIIDECGKSFGTESEARLFFELLDERHNRKKDTILITNQDEAQLQAWLGAPLVARINECGGFQECNWGEM